MKKNSLFIITLLLILFNACVDPIPPDVTDQDENIVYDTTKVIPNEDVFAAMTGAVVSYVNLSGMVINKTDEADDDSKTTKTCPTVTYEPTVGYPKTLTVDFGSSCEYNGRAYSGTIYAVVSDRLRNDGTTVSVSLENFSVDTIALKGTISITVDSAKVLTDHVAYLTISVQDGIMETPSSSYKVEMSMSVKWDLGTLTDYSDDVFYLYKGTLNGSDSDNESYSATITKELVYAVSCGNISQGKIEIQSPKFDNGATVDFGDGTCDNIATVSAVAIVTVGNQTYSQEITYELQLP